MSALLRQDEPAARRGVACADTGTKRPDTIP